MQPLPRRLALAIALSAAIGAAHADTTPQTLPFAQDWADTGQITANDNWSGVPGIVGYLGTGLTSANSVDPQTVLAADAPGVVDVIANQTNTSISNGGVAEFHIPDPAVALQGSGSANAPYIRIHLNTVGSTGIKVAYNLRDLDGSTDNAVQPVALQYRVGGIGDFTNVPEAFVADASAGPSLAGLVTPVSVTLPAAVDNQSLVELRIMTTNATGNDEWVGIDDISVTASGGGGGEPAISVGNGSVAEGDAGTSPMFFQVTLSAPAGAGGVGFDYATVDGSATAGSDYIHASGSALIPEGQSSITLSVDVIGDATIEPDETFGLVLSNLTGAVAGNVEGTGTIVNDDFVIVPIAQIQGPGAMSPLNGQVVVTEGIVTARKNNGFFMQTADGQDDGDDATSEGIFVFTAGAPSAAATVGNRVRVQATVEEYIPAADPFQLPMTELTFATVTQLATGQALPAPVVLAIDSVLPGGDLDQLEPWEGMRVSIPSATVVAPTRGNTSEANATSTSNGQFAVVVTGVQRPLREAGIQVPDPDPSGTTATAIPRWDFNPEIIAVDSDTIGAPQANLAAGCRIVDSTLTGPLDYTFRRYTIYPEGELTTACDGLDQPRGSVVPGPDHATFATYNLQRFFDTVNDPATSDPVLTAAAFANRLNKASLGIRAYMHAPDVVGVSEVENLGALQALAAKVNADAVGLGLPDPGYIAYLEEGNDVGGIDVGFLVKTGEVAAGTPRVEVLGVRQEGAAESWTYAGNGASSLLNDRPPLVLDAVVNFADGRQLPVTAIVVHQRSLSGVDSEDALGTGTTGDRVRQKRQRQAEFLAGVVQDMQAAEPERHIIVLGDFNGFEFNDGYADIMGTVTGMPSADATTAVNGDGADLVGPDLYNATYSAPAGERYSFVFDNNAQSLDHILVNAAVLESPLVDAIALSHARLNADFPETARNDANSAARLSDHDPSVLLLRLNALTFADMQAVVSTPQPAIAVAGTLRYVVDVANAGPDAAQSPGVGFAVDAELPDLAIVAPTGWTCDPASVSGGQTSSACSADSLAVSQPVVFDISAIATPATAGTEVTLTAAATSQTADTDAGNDSDSAAVSVEVHADLGVAISGPARFVRGRSSPVYTVVVDNAGPSPAAQPVVGINLSLAPARVSLQPASGWTCQTLATHRFSASCSPTDGTIAVDGTAQFTVTVDTTGKLMAPLFGIEAEVSSSAIDPVMGDNVDALRAQAVRSL